ncbi:MAG: plasmid stabilization protein [Verrucomicrobiota bacterium]
MPQGSKTAYTSKQKRKAAHIEQGYKKQGLSTKTAEARAWATVNKQDGGGKKKRATTRTRKATGSRKRPAARKRSPRARTTSRSRSHR